MQTTLATNGPALPADAEPLGSTMTYTRTEPPAPAGAAALPAWMNPPASPAPPSTRRRRSRPDWRMGTRSPR